MIKFDLNIKDENIIGHGIEAAKPFIIAGPCSVESKEQIDVIAESISKLGVRYLRGGAFKPRTSPNDFQGLGGNGVELLHAAAKKFGMKTVTEILDPMQLDQYYDYIDVIQIGSRNMTSSGLLKIVGQKTAPLQKPVLLKRGFSSTLSELIHAADYIRNEGNPNVLLCLRGIRTFEQIDSELRFTPDLASIIELKNRTDMPVIYDPSHSAGDSRFVNEISKAAIALGADGLLIETHNFPECALTDGKQSITPEQLSRICKYIEKYNSIQ